MSDNIDYETQGRVLFDVIASLDTVKLVTQVQEHLDSGWRLSGAPFDYDGWICQAIWSYAT